MQIYDLGKYWDCCAVNDYKLYFLCYKLSDFL